MSANNRERIVMASERLLVEQDESVRIAVHALGDMRSGYGSSHWQSSPSTKTSDAPTPSLSSSSSSSLSSPTISNTEQHPEDFVSRVYQLPIVNTALKAYEQGKASSRVVKYSAEMVESSVKSFSKPVIDRLPVDVNHLDDFACRQLDKIGVARQNSDIESDTTTDVLYSPVTDDAATLPVEKEGIRRRKVPADPSDELAIEPEQAESSTPAPVQRSRWQSVLLEAGGISAALSDDSMRRLKYCLHWLQYATNHIDAQIVILRDFTAAQAADGPAPSAAKLKKLQDTRRDVVQTVRQVVDVVSKYAGGALPEPARSRVRGFILSLPQRWANASKNDPAAIRRGRGGRYAHQRERGTGSQPTTPGSSRASSPTRAIVRGSHEASTAALAAQRILTLAIESLDMLRGVTSVVKESLDRAEAWVERLRAIGLQRGRPSEDEPFDTSLPPTPFMIDNSSLPELDTPYSSVPNTPVPVDAPSPGMPMGALSINNHTTPRVGLESLPEEDNTIDEVDMATPS